MKRIAACISRTIVPLLSQYCQSAAKRDLVLLGRGFEVARKEWGSHVHDPVGDIKLPPGGRPRDRRLQPGEEARLFAARREVRNLWLLPMVQCIGDRDAPG
jgi:hypothetical protein